VGYWQRAGQQVIDRSANLEAISHFTRGLEVLKTLSDTVERAQQELLLQTALASAFIAVKGMAAPEVVHAYARARELCQQVGDTPQLIPVLQGLRRFYSARAEHQRVREIGEQLLHLAESLQDPAALLEGHLALAFFLQNRGELTEARAHLEQGMALYDSQQHRSLAFRHGRDPGVTSRYSAALVLWDLGYPSQALQRSHEAITLAQELSHAYSLALALSFAARLHQCRREGQAAQERAEATIALYTEQGFAQSLAVGTSLHGWALVEQGQRETGIAQMRQGIATLQATGAETHRLYFLALLAEAYGKEGQAEEGLRVLAEALALAEKTGVGRFREAELHRLKGELLRRQTIPDAPQAEACFQQARSWELRTALSLARLWQQQGKRAEARELLAPIYGWFTEGFDTPDLREAQALLEDLGT
jgi:predicted ATPase